MACECPSCANLGTTPPHWLWIPDCEASASPRILPVPESTAAPVSSQLDSMPNTRQSAGLLGKGLADPGFAAAAPTLGFSGTSPLSAAPTVAGCTNGAKGAGSAGPPEACQAATTAGHRGPFPCSLTLLPSACGPNPSNSISSLGGCPSFTSCSPRRSGHSTRAMSPKMRSKSIREAILPAGSLNGSKWCTGQSAINALCPASTRWGCVGSFAASGTVTPSVNGFLKGSPLL
mmetsp:Transcript_43662/g.103029  ORF Transcript_43662/g.103029 Transcript_43662/m.103029 type:complete len:232 (-) Transcript_43662:302-997(-)